MTISSLLPEANGWGEKRLMRWGDKRLTAMLVLQMTNPGVRRG